ncbi:hypothetical protein EK904_005728, partial [Melospiza melodia maxima]
RWKNWLLAYKKSQMLFVDCFAFHGLEVELHNLLSGGDSSTTQLKSAAYLAVKSIVLPDGPNDLLAIMEILGGNFELPHDEDLWRDTALTFKEDAKLFQTCSFEKTELNIPFSCDITYFCGSDDKIYDAKGWQELTSGDTSFYELPGDHLYLLKPSNESFLIKHMTRSIENGL